ncbi:SRPBCC domain-containing protein [Peredibacter starrii]|uniref:SRPBCC domain-containing protein n=1 Tax=Peredibacter starrii TaxID=28202 RepID=A0AAX4HP50_9BACT|nr:SRPBCC domain-containing protein [Peredibacter starrii]WPU65032.1 SRPBCC domain-containing protein [Peredibacter starrii]
MKPIILSLMVLLTTTLFGRAYGETPRKNQIETSVIIDRNITQVWEVFSDIENYLEWSTFIESIEGVLSEGEKITVFIQPPNEDGMEFRPTILKYDEKSELRWKGKLFFTGLFDGEHYFKFESISEDRTRLIHGEKFTGILVPLVLPQIKENTLKGFNEFNAALKNKVENN